MNDKPVSRVSTIIGVVIAALVVYDLGHRQGALLATSVASPSAKVISAQEFQLTGADGKVRARLTLAHDKPTLVLYDADSASPRALLGLTAAGEPLLTLLDKDGRTPRLLADVNSVSKESGASVRLYDKTGKLTWSAP